MQLIKKRDVADQLERHSHEVAKVLQVISNQKRLLVLCILVQSGEMSASNIAKHIGLGQSALSQHLAIMRDARVVSYRRHAKQLFYYVSDERIIKILESLRTIVCSV